MTMPLSFRDVLPATLDVLQRGGIAASQASLPAGIRDVHRHLLRRTMALGVPPTLDLLRGDADVAVNLDHALWVLNQADLVHLTADGSTIETVYPFSGRPSPHQVQIDSGPSISAMCAVDALGIPLMAKAPAIISSTDPTTGEPIIVEAGPGGWRWTPDSTVVLLATQVCTGPIADACSSTAFHNTAELAERHVATLPGAIGRILSPDEATAVAGTEFGSLLDEN